LFFRITDALNLARAAQPVPPSTPPPGATRVAVCMESGDLPNVYCPHTVDTWYIPGKSPIRVSQLHRAVAIDVSTGRPACPPYSPETTRFEVYEFWPSGHAEAFPRGRCAAARSATARELRERRWHGCAAHLFAFAQCQLHAAALGPGWRHHTGRRRGGRCAQRVLVRRRLADRANSQSATAR